MNVPVCSPATENFLSTLFGPVAVAGQFIELSAWSGGGYTAAGERIPQGFIETRFIDLGVAGWAKSTISQVEKFASEGRNVYFGSAPRFRTVKPPHRSTNDDVNQLAALWVDVDAPKDENNQYADPNWKSKARAKFEHLPVAPSIRVDSGHGYHLYWLLKSPLADLDAGKALLTRIIGSIDGDPMGKNVSRLLRFPGPPNVKDPARPVMTGIDFCRDSMRFDLAYLLEAWPEKKPEKKKRVESHASGEATPGRSLTDSEKKRILEFWIDGRRRASCLAVAGAMRKAGWTEEDAAAAITEISELDGGNTTDRLNIVRTTYRDEDLDKIVGWEALRELGVKDGEIPSIEKPLKGRKKRPKPTDLFTDMTNAREFVDDHGDEFRYLRDTLAWMKWDGKRWAPNATVDVELAAITTADRLYGEALEMPTRTVEETVNKDAALEWAKQSQSWRTRQAMIRSAAPQPEMACATTMLDQHPDWLNVANGTIDLRTGELMPHQREHLISRLAPINFDPKAEAPMWERFIVDIFQGKPELLMFVQIAIGYTLTGRTNEQCFFLMYGDGSNGKGTFIETIKLLLGDLAQTTPFSTFLVKKNDGGIPADIAMLRGARFVTASEADQNARFSEALIKQLTGQDEVSARFMRENFFKFIPEFKLWLSVNHKPVIRGTDLGIWRRIKLIPFEAKFDGANKDPHLRDKLRLELPGILSWAVTGARLWYQHACLPESESVQAATAEYREESDIVGLFLASDVVVIGEGFRTKSSELFDVWRSWCDKNGFFAGNQTSFGRLMREKGYASKAGKGANFFAGIARATSSADQLGESRRYSGEEF